MNFEILFKGLDKAKTAFNHISDINNETQEVTKSMEEAATAISHVDKTIRKTDAATKQLAKNQKVLENNVGNVGDKFKNATGTKPIFDMIDKSKEMAKVFGGGINGMIKAVFALGTSLATVLLPVLAIGAAFFLLKKIWDANIGGIQTKFFKVFGAIRSLWAKFEVGLIKGLKIISAVLGFILRPFFNQVKLLFAILKGMFSIIGAVLKPIFDAFKEIGTVIGEIFGGAKKDMIGFSVLMKIIGFSAKLVGKILGFVVKTTIMPFVLGIRMIGRVVKLIRFVIDSLKQTKGFQFILAIGQKIASAFIGLKNIFVSIKDGIVSVIDGIWTKIKNFINLLPKPIKFLLGFGGELQSPESKPLASPAAQAGGNANNTNNQVNNNQQINVTTSREITQQSATPFSDMLANQLQTGF